MKARRKTQSFHSPLDLTSLHKSFWDVLLVSWFSLPSATSLAYLQIPLPLQTSSNSWLNLSKSYVKICKIHESCLMILDVMVIWMDQSTAGFQEPSSQASRLSSSNQTHEPLGQDASALPVVSIAISDHLNCHPQPPKMPKCVSQVPWTSLNMAFFSILGDTSIKMRSPGEKYVDRNQGI